MPLSKSLARTDAIVIGFVLPLRTAGGLTAHSRSSAAFPRKEVIQPQVPLRLPCYDFTPITTHTLGAYLPAGLAQRLLVHTAFVV
jgi:hypothetical protein